MNARNQQSAYDRCFATPVRDPAIWEEAALRYDRCHPGDSFADLAYRSSFSKEDRRLLEDWLSATAGLSRDSFDGASKTKSSGL